MDKRYQVFVSSTYVDLKEERQEIIQALMEMDCIPAGMELFPAADEDQFAFITRVIDDCDYYVLLIGGRYGSLSSDGISYTEREYEYALSKNIRVIALLHENPAELPLVKSEGDPAVREQLKKFRDRVSTGRLVRLWKTSSELPGIVALSLSKTIKSYPATGWVRADRIASESALNELNEVRKQNDLLQADLRLFRESLVHKVDDLAGLDEPITLSGSSYGASGEARWKARVTWRQIFSAIGPYILGAKPSSFIKDKVADMAFHLSGKNGRVMEIDDQDFQTIGVQLMALGLISVSDSSRWSATRTGERLTMELRTIKTARPPE